MTPAGFPHSEIPGSQLGWQLPGAYRSLLRPSSAPGAKASTMCSLQLDHKDARVPLCGSQGAAGRAGTLHGGCAHGPSAGPLGGRPGRRSDDRSSRTQQRAWAARRRRLEVPRHCRAAAVLTRRRRRAAYWSMFHPRAPVSRANASGTGLGAGSHRRQVLLRKEVIQPHLPVRLPCYDFVPIASPTFDGSLPCGLGHRLRVLPTFVT